MNSLAEALAKKNLSEEFHFGEDLSNELIFLESAKKEIEKEFNKTLVQFYFARKIMTFSVEITTAPTTEIAKKLIFCVDSISDELFRKKKTLYEIGWCSSYMIDKRLINSKEFYEKYNKSLDEMAFVASESYFIKFSWLNISPNPKVYKKEGETSTLVPFSLCNYFNCKSILQLMLRKKTLVK